METKKLTTEQLAALKAPLPKEAIKQHPTKPYLSSIKVIYMVERLNDVFGLGGWFVNNEVVEATEDMVVIKATFTAPEYGILVENFGGNDNSDRGDAYKGACTDALSKICSYLYVGMDVYKGHEEPARSAPARKFIPPSPAPTAKPRAIPAAPTSAQAADLVTLNISEVTKEQTKGGKPYLWVRDGRKSVACFKAELYDAINEQMGENVTFRVEQGPKGPHIVGIASTTPPPVSGTLGIDEGDIPF